MTKSKNPPVAAPATKRAAVPVEELTMHAELNAAAIIQEYAKPLGERSLQSMVTDLGNSCVAVQNGDMRECEAMLMSQAKALQAIFMNLSRRALVQERQAHFESFFRMAMKAQNQCRMTVETLSAIKNPPVVFAKQANIAHGHQQVNNSVAAPVRTENEIPGNEESGASHELLPHTRASQVEVRTDPPMETMGALNRTPHRRRKGN